MRLEPDWHNWGREAEKCSICEKRWALTWSDLCEPCQVRLDEQREQEYLDYYGYRKGPNNTILGWE